MHDYQRFSILPFPQEFDGNNQLRLRIVVLPRDQNPLNPAIVPQLVPGPTPAPAFADANFSFTANVFTSLAGYPTNTPDEPNILLTTNAPGNKRELLEAMGNHLQITNGGTTFDNTNINLQGLEQPEAAQPVERTVRKHLPKSYCQSFNFTGPRTKNATTDDSYACALRDAEYVPTFQRDPDAVSWGKVFAHLLRHPIMAQRAGFVYETTLTVQPNYFPNGGWLFIDLASTSDFFAEQQVEPNFIKRYAARIPALEPGQSRQVFAPLLFPVTNTPDGNYDQLFQEAAEYDDGFAKIVHCQQPPNRNLLREDNDGDHPTKDLGIRLGWDDEQILIWYMRQLSQDASTTTGDRIDAPMGVFGYHIDVRQTANPPNAWNSLNWVDSRMDLNLRRNPSDGDQQNVIQLGSFNGELPFEVYPSQLDGRTDQAFWLPMYFANWTGHSMVLSDPDAIAIYQNANENLEADPERDVLDENNMQVLDSNGHPARTGTGVVDGGVQDQLNQLYASGPINAPLRYGENYQFRIRMRDISGGGPAIDRGPINTTGSDTTTCRFKRYLSPAQPRIDEFLPTGNDDNPLINTDELSAPTLLNIRRPLLGYPAVVYTGKYADPIQRLITRSTASIDLNGDPADRTGLGIADPDVNRLEIAVEIESLRLDKVDSLNGKEDYVHLYTTYRSFPIINTDNDYELPVSIPIIYRDVPVLHTGATVDIVQDLQLPGPIDSLSELYLPSGRTIRLTIRAVAEPKTVDEHYYGFLHPENKRLDNRYGETFQMRVYQPSADETNLFVQTAGVPELQGIYFQSDAANNSDGRVETFLFGERLPSRISNIQQLADQLELEATGLTLAAPKGERVVFGCSSRIRHTLSPDHSSLTFASKGDLAEHWLCCISLTINRDWMWDALRDRSLLIRRVKHFTADAPLESEVEGDVVGDIELYRTASFESLHQPERDYTRIVFIDAVEPKPDDPGNQSFPDTIEVSYQIDPRFKPDHATQQDPAPNFPLTLPITTPPAQVPKLVSAGYALSPYVRNEQYSATEVRERFLWLEFDEPITDPQDTLFARVLALAPDQLISNNNPSLLAAPKEPDLPIDPEFMRVITAGSTNNLAGLNAMQPMQKSTSSDRHYLLPLPPGLHADSDELFGFFTYEFRIGHYQKPNSEDFVYTTAQGRFGRRLRVYGVQHPAPTLTCMPNRDEVKLWVTAPYAVAVHDGKNVTADPPRTELWALLYAQVNQADRLDHRNILLDDRPLDWRITAEPERDVDPRRRYREDQLQVLQAIAQQPTNPLISVNTNAKLQVMKLVDFSNQNKDRTKYGTAIWTNEEVAQLLELYCLPPNSSLSVVVVETYGHTTNIYDHVTDLERRTDVGTATATFVPNDRRPQFTADLDRRRQFTAEVDRQRDTAISSARAVVVQRASPVDEALGHYRILRTSPLTEVPDICCDNC